MHTSHRALFVLGLLTLVFATQTSFSQTVTSTTAGGNWEATSTWIGGVVPGSTSDVTVDGPVGYATGAGYSCRTLTVTSRGSLFNRTGYAWPDQILIVNGSVTNYGTIRNESSIGLVLRVQGNISNNGIWTLRRTELTGSSTQVLSLASGKTFDSPFKVTGSAGLIAGSDIKMSSSVDLNKVTLNMASFTLTLVSGAAGVTNGSVSNAMDIVGVPSSDDYPVMDNISYDGSPNIKGRLKIHTLVVLTGNVTVTDTIENLSGYAHPEKMLKIVGNLTNNGIIRNYYSSGLALNVTGNITNNGTWQHNRTELSGSADQTLALGAGKMFEASFSVTDSTIGGVVAGSDLVFARAFNLGKATLDVKNFAITLYSEGTNIYNGTVTNTKDLVGKPTGGTSYPYLDNITYNGNPNLKGRLRIHTMVVLKGNVTVTDTLENLSGYAHAEKILKIDGNVTNNGIVRNFFSAGLALNVTGNITNNAQWQHNRTELSGSADQILSLGAGKMFEASFSVTDSVIGGISAGTDLAFARPFNLGKASLDMKNLAITLHGSGTNIYNGSVNNTKDIIGKAVGGTSYPYLDNITYNGNPNLKGRLKIHTLVVLKGNVTVTDTLENLDGYGHPEKTLKIVGNITNNGIIRNNYSYGLALNVTGNVTNNGTWVHNRTELSGTGSHILSLGTKKIFEAAFKVTDSTVTTSAGSDLAFSSWFDLLKSVLDMKTYSLTLQGPGASIANGIVINTRDLVGKSTGDAYSTPILDNVTYSGTISLRGLVRVNSGTLVGNVTVVDTVQNSSGYGHPEKVLKIIGSITNNGVVRDGGSYGLVLDVTGSITANKSFVNNRIQLAGTGNRTIVDKVSTLTYRSTGDKVVLVGENYMPNLSVGAQSKCQLANGGNLYVPNSDIDETLDNWSAIGVTRKLAAGRTNSFFKARATILPTSTIDSLKVSTYGHQVPSTFANAVRTWWRINRIPRTGSPSLASFTMYYSQEELSPNIEANLQVYYSADSGKSWQQVSTTLNMTRNGTDNFVTITDVASSGDYVLSSNPDPVSVRPSIMATVIGRSQIRVGAPNRFTIQYVNNSDFPTDDFLLSLNTGPNVGMDKSEHLLPDGTKETLPKDSLSFDTGDTSYVYYVRGMQPRESRQFDVVATAYPGLRKGAFFDPFSITVGTVVVWGAKAAATYAIVKTIDYLGDKARQGLQFTPQQKRDWEGTVGKIPEEIARTDTKKEWAMKKVSGKLIEKAMGVVGGTVDVARAVGRNISGIVPNLRRQIWYWLYKETGLYGVEEQTEDASYKAEVSNASSKTGQPVTSWDPNEKVGPAGIGSQGFISTLGKMNYQILFENKKEATAPAYKVVIVDTLRAEFDPSTVEFGKTSHDDPQYVWKMTRTNNILRWEIEGIELPPNVVPPAGEGYVTFSVMPLSSLASGTALRNSATITFDMNKPIATNTFVNTIDFQPPTTVMKPLPSTYNKQNLTVKWVSSDGTMGSGVQSVSVFASKDGEPFQAVGSSLTDSLTIKIVNGAYRFYALATDNVGNSELSRPALVQTTASGVVDVEKEPELPLEFVLEQNYPNPFNPSTTISYALDVKARASLKVFDLLGREVADLVDEDQLAGRHAVTWDAGKLASGVYFYRLAAGDRVATRKLVLLK